MVAHRPPASSVFAVSPSEPWSAEMLRLREVLIPTPQHEGNSNRSRHDSNTQGRLGRHIHRLASLAIMRAATSIGMTSYISFALTVGTAHCFLPARGLLARPRHPSSSSTTSHSSPVVQSSKTPNELFDSPGWDAIKRELDQIPVFSIANAEGQPIKYRIEKTGDASFEVPLFYTHVSDALAELEKAKENTPLPGMDINPYPLGGIFEMWARDTA